jgi:hydroxyacylglutathione hydrolase
VVRTAGPRAVSIVLTHSHWDHVLGLPWWPAARVIGHARLAAELERDGPAVLAEAVNCAWEHGERWDAGFVPFAPDEAIADERPLEAGPWRLVLRAAPGHCDSQITIHLPERRLLLAGDQLSSIEIPWLDRGPAIYRATIEGIARGVEAGAIETLVPGHGPLAHGAAAVRARVRRELGYLDGLEADVRQARERGLTLAEAQAQLPPPAPPAPDTPFPLAQVHRDNVRFAWEAIPPEPA